MTKPCVQLFIFHPTPCSTFTSAQKWYFFKTVPPAPHPQSTHIFSNHLEYDENMCGAFHVPPKTMLQSCHLHISTKMVLFQNCTPCPHPPNTHILLIPPIALAQGIHTRSNDLMRQYSTEYSNELVHMIR